MLICRYCGSSDDCEKNVHNIVVCGACTKKINNSIERKKTKKVKITVYLSERCYTKMLIYCNQHKINIEKFIEQCVKDYKKV